MSHDCDPVLLGPSLYQSILGVDYRFIKTNEKTITLQSSLRRLQL